jgi:hypothetical protein
VLYHHARSGLPGCHRHHLGCANMLLAVISGALTSSSVPTNLLPNISEVGQKPLLLSRSPSLTSSHHHPKVWQKCKFTATSLLFWLLLWDIKEALTSPFLPFFSIACSRRFLQSNSQHFFYTTTSKTHTSSSNTKNNKMSSDKAITFSAREMEVLALAWQCMEAQPKVSPLVPFHPQLLKTLA